MQIEERISKSLFSLGGTLTTTRTRTSRSPLYRFIPLHYLLIAFFSTAAVPLLLLAFQLAHPSPRRLTIKFPIIPAWQPLHPALRPGPTLSILSSLEWLSLFRKINFEAKFWKERTPAARPFHRGASTTQEASASSYFGFSSRSSTERWGP